MAFPPGESTTETVSLEWRTVPCTCTRNTLPVNTHHGCSLLGRERTLKPACRSKGAHLANR